MRIPTFGRYTPHFRVFGTLVGSAPIQGTWLARRLYEALYVLPYGQNMGAVDALYDREKYFAFIFGGTSSLSVSMVVVVSSF